MTLQVETTYRVKEATHAGEAKRIVPTVYTSQGVPISVTGIAQVKVQGQNKEMLLVNFLNFQMFDLMTFKNFSRPRANNS